MIRGTGLVLVGAALVGGALVLGSSGCQSESSSSGPGPGGSGGSPSSTGTGGATSTGTGGTGGGTGGAGQVVTIQEVTTNVVGPAIVVQLKGVVAMSQKFLVSKGSSSGSCLWGVFVSAPNITETAENTGILVVSYGFNAMVPDGGTTAYCPALSFDPTGDAIPDDIKPGDVVDLQGETSYFLLSNCASEPMGSTVAQYQIAKTTSMTKTGTATPPTPHVLTGADIAALASPTDKAFHDKWGGVKVRVENLGVIPQDDPEGGANQVVVGDFGIVKLAGGSGLQFADKLYYRGYQKNEVCHAGPVYSDLNMTFTAVEGFSLLNFCTWDIEPNSKCDDLFPPSEDCAGMSCE